VQVAPVLGEVVQMVVEIHKLCCHAVLVTRHRLVGWDFRGLGLRTWWLNFRSLRDLDPEFKIQVQKLGIGVQGSEFRVQGTGFRVHG